MSKRVEYQDLHLLEMGVKRETNDDDTTSY